MTSQACQNCQKSIPRHAPAGLCPECLLREGLRMDSAPTTSGVPGSTVDGGEPQDAALSTELAGRYATLEASGQGGMGKVYLVRDAQLGREVALKELLPRGAVGSPESEEEEKVALARFTREARVTAQLQHPAITPVYELGRRTDGSYYYTMKHVRGRTLAQALKDAKTLDDRLRLLPNFVDLCHAIAFAHSRGVIHRDIKPANVMVGDFGETVVVDWGLAKVKGIVEAMGTASSSAKPVDGVVNEAQGDGFQTMHGTALGTPAYMPPEQAQGLIGTLDQRSDIYSLGAVLYEILAGRRPFAGASAREILSEVLTKPPMPLAKVDPAIPLEYARICERAMSRLPEERPASASELADQVQNVRLRAPKSQARRWSERAALLGLLLAPLGVMLFNRWTDGEVNKARERLSTKGFDLRSGPEDYGSYGPSTPLPAGARHGAGTLFALTWEFPQLGDRESDLWKRVNALRVRDASFPWPKGSSQHVQAVALAGEVEPVIEAIRATAALPRGGGRAVIKKAMDLGGTPFATEIPNSPALMSGANLLAHTAYLAYTDGRIDRGLEATAAGLRFASHLEDIPFLVGVLVRANMVGTALIPLEHAYTSLPQATDAALEALDRALRESSLAPSVPFAVESEIRCALFAFHLVRTPRVAAVATVMEGTPNNLPPILWTLYGRGPLRSWSNRDEVLYLGFMTDALEASRRPAHEALPDLGRIDSEVKRSSSVWHPMLGMFPSVKGVVTGAATVDSSIARARIRGALERYRRRHGAFPKSLQDLSPAWLESVPVHSLTGAPFLYSLTASGYDLADPKGPSVN